MEKKKFLIKKYYWQLKDQLIIIINYSFYSKFYLQFKIKNNNLNILRIKNILDFDMIHHYDIMNCNTIHLFYTDIVLFYNPYKSYSLLNYFSQVEKTIVILKSEVVYLLWLLVKDKSYYFLYLTIVLFFEIEASIGFPPSITLGL